MLNHTPQSEPCNPVVLLTSLIYGAHHFPGVVAELRALGYESIVNTSQRHSLLKVSPDQLEQASVILHPDSVSHSAINLLDDAQRTSKPILLIMDGLLEYANTFLNPRAGTNFLRPAPADIVLASGQHDASILQALGNHALPTGLPRLADFAHGIQAQPTQSAEPQSPTILIATANQPAFTPGARVRLLEALAQIKAHASRSSITLRWRIAKDFAQELGVINDQCSLSESIADVRAVLTSASTLAIESMIANKPTAIIHPHPWPLWVPAAWLYCPDLPQGIEEDRSAMADLHAQDAPANDAAADSIAKINQSDTPHTTAKIDHLFDSILAPQADHLALQSRILEHFYHEDAPARVARAVIEHHRA